MNMKFLTHFLFIGFIVSCSSNDMKDESNTSVFYLNSFFCRNMNSIIYHTYEHEMNSAENVQLRKLINDIISDSHDTNQLREHGKVMSSLLDSMLVKKSYLRQENDLVEKIKATKRDLKSTQLGQLYDGLYVGAEIIISLNFMSFCGFGIDRIGLFVTDSIILEANKLYEFNFDVRPLYSNIVYYNTYSRNDSINKTKIYIDTRYKSENFTQEISASITNPITFETKTYTSPINVIIK